jgi:magnesium transporter
VMTTLEARTGVSVADPRTNIEVVAIAEASVERRARTRAYCAGHLKSEDFPFEQLSDYLREPDTFVWVDLCPPHPDELKLVAQELGLHELAVEDAVEVRQRPKLDRYADHQLLSMYAVQLDRDSGALVLSELAVFITPSALVTVRMDDSFDMDRVVESWDDSSDLAGYGVGFLLYGLVDHVVDGHFDAVQALDEEIDALEDLLFDGATRSMDVQRRSFGLRKSLVILRRVVLPMREVVNSLMRRDLQVVDEELAPYFQDVYDHVLRATEWTESLRDLVSTIVETNLTIQGNRLNIITKKVTSWAAIIAVPTAITGFYGQNLPFPGFADRSGFIASSILITVLPVSLYVMFRRKDWL